MRSIIPGLIISILLISCMLETGSAPSTLSSPVVRFDPATVELGPDYCVNDTFTLEAKIDDVARLVQFSFEIVWNTTYLEYVDHVLKAPVEIYADGVLHEPVIIVIDAVNDSIGWYGASVATIGAVPSFNGSGTAFEITFKVKRQPIPPEPNVSFLVAFTLDFLVDEYTGIPHDVNHCNVTIYPYWYPADVNDDLKVDIFDVVLGVNAYQATPSDPHWNPRCDIANPYEIINIFDIVMIASSYGEEYAS